MNASQYTRNQALAVIRQTTDVAKIEPFLQHEDPAVRREAVYKIARLRKTVKTALRDTFVALAEKFSTTVEIVVELYRAKGEDLASVKRSLSAKKARAAQLAAA